MFWSGLLGILLFASILRWLPSTGQGSVRHLILPAAVLGFACVGTITRTVRSGMVEVLRLDYMTTARAKGLPQRTVIGRHALRNALIPVVTMIGLQFGWLLGGAVIIETIFGRQGLGHLLVEAILVKDFPLIQGGVLFSAIMYLTISLVVDLAYGFIDPRIRYD
jgi:ABC-type dipeptide/oligopeptide/nickel transport system permease component